MLLHCSVKAFTRFGISTLLISLLFLLNPLVIPAAESTSLNNENQKDFWSLYGGYGVSHKNLGKTKVEAHVLDLIPRYERVLLDNMGSSWYQGEHSLFVELPFTMVVDPVVAPMIGINIMGAWTFTSNKEVRPYMFGGGGILYTSADILGLGSEVNGNWQFGGGLRFKLESGNWMNVEYRFHHISNTGVKDPNDPLNSSKILIGVTF